MYYSNMFLTAMWALFLCVNVAESVPVFVVTAATNVSVAENAATGAVVTTSITATGTNSITYTLKSQIPDSTPKKFAVDGTTGSITVNDTLDFEDVMSYILTISATNTVGVVDHTLTVNVTDFDEAPVFSVVKPNVTIVDAAAIGTELTTITATDPEGATVTYTITPTTDFGIAATGVITSKTVVNRTATPSFTLTVTATDQTAKAATTVVTVSVTEKSGGLFLHCGYMALLMSLLLFIER